MTENQSEPAAVLQEQAQEVEAAAAAADGMTVEEARERQYVPEHDDHGRTPANWTVCILIMVAFTAGTLALIFGQTVVFWISVALIPISLIIGKVMSGMGYGSSGHHES